MTTRVSTAGNYSAVLANLMAAQARQSQAGDVVASQKNGTDLKGYAKDAEMLTSMRSINARNAGYLEQHKQIADKLTVQDLAFTQLQDSALGIRDALASAVASNRADTTMQELQEHFRNAIDSLNMRYGGKYLFAGGAVDTKPVTATDLADLTAAPAVSDLFQNDDYAVKSKIDDATTIRTGFLADEVGQQLFEALEAIQAYHEGPNGPLTGQLTDDQADFIKAQLGGLDDIHDRLITVTAQNGLLQNRVDQVADDVGARQDSLTGMMGDITDADMAEAVSRLQMAQFSVQASAQVFSMLQETSLLNFLKL
ncbi:MAG: flagellin [Caulobacteraceae bacterium]|nr:flagellin [Caulobacteraceae bacterium]